MRAAILSIGDELTLGQNLDTNSQWLASRLIERSIVTIEHRTVADDRQAIGAAVRELLKRCEVLITTGGLGPTDDDLTREALNDVVAPSQPMIEDAEAASHLDNWFTKRGRRMPEINRRQTLRPATMRCLPNANGTAPGLAGAHEGCLVFCLPGPPREMQPMFVRHVLPALPESDAEVILTGMVQEFGMGESVAAERLGDLMIRTRNPLVGTTASDSVVSARVRAQGARTTAKETLQRTLNEIERLWHPYAFGREGALLVDSVAALLKKKRQTLATAESCTGGWLGKAIVDLAGSSAFFLGGWITYSNEIKSAQLGVPVDLIAEHGAVSREAAAAMAEGARARSGAHFALAITGIAGPEGGTAEKPVGTVYIALAEKGAERALVRHFEFSAERAIVRDRSVKAALQMLRFRLLEVAPDTPLLWEVRPDDGRQGQSISGAAAGGVHA